jgi:tetratricopeptide (TPR) repeat protein
VDRKVAALKVLGDYLRLLLFPIHLSADYSRMPADFLAEVYSWDGVLSLLVLLVFTLSLYLQRRERHAVFGVWFFVTFLVASNLLTLSGTVMGERLAYLPSVGFIAYCTLTVDRARMATTSVLVFLLVACLWARTAVRQAVWRDNESLMKQTVQDAPRSPKALYNYAVFLLDEKKEPSKAKELFRNVLAMDSTHILTLMCLSDIAAQEKQYEEMAEWYRRILTIDPSQTKIRQELERYEKWRQSQSATRSDS